MTERIISRIEIKLKEFIFAARKERLERVLGRAPAT